MNAIKTGTAPGSSPWVAMALEALRGIGRREVVAAATLGLVLFAADAVSFFVMLFVDQTSLPLPVLLTDHFISRQVKSFSLMAAVVIADRAVDLGAPMRRAYVAAALGGSLLGILLTQFTSWPFLQWMMANAWPAHWLHGVQGLVFGLIFDLTHWVLIAGAAVFLYADRRTARRTEARLHAAELNRIRASRTALESRLQAMQARVEPQFLFNTLAQVEQLFEHDPPAADRMLDDLIAYLRAAMPAMRDTSSTVGREVELARAYLDIVRLRLGERLRVSVNVPAEARDARMPPMMLLPLIDHAVVRGLEPATTSGTIDIAARVGGGRLTLTIEDRGAGLVPETDGDGVAGIRQRLDALYRGDATLDLRRAGPQTTAAVLDLPVEAAEAMQDPARPAKG